MGYFKNRTALLEKSEPMLAAYEFWRDLQVAMKARGYEYIGISRGNNSEYLVLAGTADQITWHGKPELSFRLAKN